MKKSLLITDDQKYGRNPSGPLSPSSVTEGPGKKEKPVKRGILIELVGPQVDAFCTCSMKVGDTGSAEVHYKIKSVSEGESYDDAVNSSKNSPKRMKLLLTHVEADNDGDEGEEGDDKADSPAEENSEAADGGEDASDGDGTEKPDEAAPDRLSPKDAGLDDDE